MSRRSRSEFALLGLLSKAPRSGYDVRREVTDTLSHFWAESYGNIYPVLHRLHEQGLVNRATKPGSGGPPRQEYSITEDGLEELKAWLSSPIAPSKPRNELPLRVYLSSLITDAELAALLRDFANQLGSRMAFLAEARSAIRGEAHATGSSEISGARSRKRESTPAPAPRELMRWLMTIDLGIRSMEAVLGWCEDTIATLENAPQSDE